MSKKRPVNIAASVRQRLLDKARIDKRPFNELLQYFVMERFLYRLSRSNHADKFVLKGALMLRAWQAPLFRPTMDIDMLARQTSNEVKQIVDLIKNVCQVVVDSDGIEFDSESVRGENIVEDADYEGVRVLFVGKLDTVKIRMQVDIGFGDVVVPGPQETILPTMLDFPPPCIACYSRESSIAEKFEAMVKLDELNSRMKDFYDIWLLVRQFDFYSPHVQDAVASTLNNRGTDLPNVITAFTNTFIHAKSTQWGAFRKKLDIDTVPMEFAEVNGLIQEFLGPILDGIRTQTSVKSTWTAPGPWQ